MTNTEEWSNQFDLLYNNITSNQAPGLTEYEKSVFLTKAQDEIVKNYFSANSAGNILKQGFDDSAKRQADFSTLVSTNSLTEDTSYSGIKLDPRSVVFFFPSDVFIVINESLMVDNNVNKIRQVIPLKYDEYMRLMSKPYKRPLKNQVWRLIAGLKTTKSEGDVYKSSRVEIVTAPNETENLTYMIRYIRRPLPILLADFSEDGLSINGYDTPISGVCELPDVLHEDVLQRGVEVAKVAWTATGSDNANTMLQTGQRSE